MEKVQRRGTLMGNFKWSKMLKILLVGLLILALTAFAIHVIPLITIRNILTNLWQ